MFTLASNWDEGEAGPEVPDQIATVSRNIATMRRDRRRDLLHAVAAGEADPGASADLIETIRWIDSTAYHVARAIDHLADLDHTSVHSLAFESPSDPMIDATPAGSDDDNLSR